MTFCKKSSTCDVRSHLSQEFKKDLIHQQKLKDDDNSNDNTQNKEEMCKWKPGMKLSECEMCSE